MKKDDAMPNDAFDEMLTAALRRRPTRPAGIDLAATALTRARAAQANEDQLARLLRLKRWARVTTIAAAALVALTVAVGYQYLPTLTSDAVADTVTTSSFNWTTAGIAVFVVALTAVALASLFTPDRPQMHLTPT